MYDFSVVQYFLLFFPSRQYGLDIRSISEIVSHYIIKYDIMFLRNASDQTT